jgi:hypothetical protein
VYANFIIILLVTNLQCLRCIKVKRKGERKSIKIQKLAQHKNVRGLSQKAFLSSNFSQFIQPLV